LVDTFTRFLPQSAVTERSADAHGWFAVAEEGRADVKVWLLTQVHSVLSDAKIPFGLEVERSADAHGYFAGDVGEAFADAYFALGQLIEQRADALVYFGTMSEVFSDARLVNLHISDVSKINEFVANYLPEIWRTKEWGVLVVPLKRGEAKRVALPARSMEKGVLYLARYEWWIETLPNDASEAIVYNQSHPYLVAFVYFFLR